MSDLIYVNSDFSVSLDVEKQEHISKLISEYLRVNPDKKFLQLGLEKTFDNYNLVMIFTNK